MGGTREMGPGPDVAADRARPIFQSVHRTSTGNPCPLGRANRRTGGLAYRWASPELAARFSVLNRACRRTISRPGGRDRPPTEPVPPPWHRQSALRPREAWTNVRVPRSVRLMCDGGHRALTLVYHSCVRELASAMAPAVVFPGRARRASSSRCPPCAGPPDQPGDPCLQRRPSLRGKTAIGSFNAASRKPQEYAGEAIVGQYPATAVPPQPHLRRGGGMTWAGRATGPGKVAPAPLKAESCSLTLNRTTFRTAQGQGVMTGNPTDRFRG